MIPLGQLGINLAGCRNRHTGVATDEAIEFRRRGRKLLAIADELLLKATKFQRCHEHVPRLGIASSDPCVGSCDKRLKLRLVGLSRFNLLPKNIELVPCGANIAENTQPLSLVLSLGHEGFQVRSAALPLEAGQATGSSA